MNLYDKFMTPIEKRWLRKVRSTYIPTAIGKVLEVGFGTGANYPFYDFSKVEKLVASDIKNHTLKGQNVEFIEASIESLPFADNSFDTIVASLILCSVENPAIAVKEIERVLKPSGRYIFMEHVRPAGKIGSMFDKLNYIWKAFSKGCQINKNTLSLIEQLDWKIESYYLGDILCFGVATKKI